MAIFLRSSVKRLVTTILFLVVPGLTTQAHAYGYIDNRGLLPVGEIESFMANTGTALSGSTGAVYYNPAGLASIERSHISVSANSYLSTKSRLNPIQTIDGVDFDFSTKGLQAIPSAFVSTGQKDKWKYAFSVLIPHQTRVQDSVAYSTPSYPTFQFSRTNFFQVLMAGLSVARSEDTGFDWGVGCFYTMYQTTQSSALVGQQASTSNSLIINSYMDAQVDGVMCNAGIQKQQSENLRWGLIARLPMMTVSKKGTASQFVQNPNNGQSQADGPKAIQPESPMPLDMTLGFEYLLSKETRAYLDASYQMDVSYKNGDLDGTTSKNKSTLRASVGLRHRWSEQFELYAGAMYNPSSVQPNEIDYAENFVSGTLGGRWASGSSNIGVGLLYAQSTGTRDALEFDASLNQIGRRSASVATQAVGVMVSSGYVF